ncbi:MAG: TatD family hydrolase [Candidatus Thalassarchaeaceae archaeon]|jgi:TatD-related deoxyribonuclease|nr:TatD family hydrolase [Candidatus Thalassarchaeaceae archaeon]
MSLQGDQWVGPIWDSHIHLDRNGRCIDAAQDFERSGGTHMCLVHKPAFPNRLPENIHSVDDAYRETLRIAELIRGECNLDVRVILGPHPVVWEKQIHTLGLEDACELHLASVELALEYCAEGKAVGIGEVGRPHYPVEQEIMKAADLQLTEIMRMAAKENVPIQLHVDDNGAQTNMELALLCDRAGLSRERAIHHYAQADVSADFTHGLSASVSMGKESVQKIVETCFSSNSTWTMETDYMDDLSRPGAVLGPKTIPKRTHALVHALLQHVEPHSVEELLLNIHQFWPNSLYGNF